MTIPRAELATGESYFLQVKSDTPTRLWINNPTLAELALAIQAGAVGCTTNPSYAGGLLRRKPDEVLPIIRECIEETEDPAVAAGLVQLRLVARIAETLAPVHGGTDHEYGYVSIQGAPDQDHDSSLILAEGRAAAALAPNVAVKIPATAPGLSAFEQLVADGVPTIVTEVFSLSQLTETCEIYLRVSESGGHRPPFFISPITGIFGDYLRAIAVGRPVSIGLDVVEWAGVALARACNAIVEDRHYPVTLLFGGARSPIDFTGLVGSRTAATINYSTISELLERAPSIEDTIHTRVDDRVIADLTESFDDFARAMTLDGLAVEEFEQFGPVLHFRATFLASWQALMDACARMAA